MDALKSIQGVINSTLPLMSAVDVPVVVVVGRAALLLLQCVLYSIAKHLSLIHI